jgi:hypothetical protein
VREGEKIHGDAAGLPLGQGNQKRVDGEPVGLAREQLVPVDEVSSEDDLTAASDHLSVRIDDLRTAA